MPPARHQEHEGNQPAGPLLGAGRAWGGGTVHGRPGAHRAFPFSAATPGLSRVTAECLRRAGKQACTCASDKTSTSVCVYWYCRATQSCMISSLSGDRYGS